ncbi:MAG: Crp/Fnr family transcriptional regulator [Segetibacter sp.]
MLIFYGEELQESEKRMRNLAHMALKGRLAYGLLRLKERFGITEQGLLNIGITRQDLASYVGTTYETAFHIMTELSKENLIRFLDKGIYILDEQALSNIVYSSLK